MTKPGLPLPHFPYVDAHVHFWDQRVMPYGWLAEVPSIAGPHTPAELRGETAEHPPAKLVFVECGAPGLDEVKWVSQLAAQEPRLAGIVAKVMVDEGRATSAALEAVKAFPLVRGVRHLIQDRAEDYASRREFIVGVRAVGAAGLSFDLCCRHHQFPGVLRLVRACPDTRFILDHFGKPDIKGQVLRPWKEQMSALATLPNVDCKLSGLITEANHASWTLADLRPYVDHALATFGPKRLLFGGDWPVVKLAGTYVRWYHAARVLVSHLSSAEQTAIFHDTACRVYRLG